MVSNKNTNPCQKSTNPSSAFESQARQLIPTTSQRNDGKMNPSPEPKAPRSRFSMKSRQQIITSMSDSSNGTRLSPLGHKFFKDPELKLADDKHTSQIPRKEKPRQTFTGILQKEGLISRIGALLFLLHFRSSGEEKDPWIVTTTVIILLLLLLVLLALNRVWMYLYSELSLSPAPADS